MRPPRPRLTLRRLMISVAAVSLLLGLAIEAHRLSRLRANYRSLAAIHANEIASLRLTEGKILKSSYPKVQGFTDPVGFLGLNPLLHATNRRIVTYEDAMEKLAQRRKWHERMREKYQRAASHPWLTAEPEPPPL
jgi:hypothetical protein